MTIPTVPPVTEDLSSHTALFAQARPWPKPLAPEAFHGLAGEIVHAIDPVTEADPAAVLMQLLVAVGSAAGREAYFRVEGDRHGLNLFVAVVGDTSKARKGTSWGRVLDLTRAVDQEWAAAHIVQGLSSGEGLIWAVRDPITKTEAIRDKKTREVTGYQDVVVDEGVSDKRLLVVESELASTLRVMGRDGNTLSPVLREAWDSGNLRTLTKNSPAAATGAHVSIIGHITADELRRYLDRTEVANGLGNRFLWLCAKRSKTLPEGGGEISHRPELVRRLYDALEFGSSAGELRRDDDARALWAGVYPQLSEGAPGLLGAMTARGEAQVMRLAALYAVLDCSVLIRVEHLYAALAAWDYVTESVAYIFGDSLGDPVADEILTALRARPEGMTRTDLRDFFGRHRTSEQIGRALASLQVLDLVRCQQETTAGRPAERWFAVSTKGGA
jgi:hypothetical protein